MTREERVALDALSALATVSEAGGAIVMRVPEAPESPMLNRIVGLGVDRPATEGDVDEVLAAMGAGFTFYVAVAPDARPVELSGWLRSRGLEPGWGWMAFHRDVAEPPPAETSLRLVLVETPAEAAALAHVMRVSYGLPEAVEPRLAGAPGAGWLCWLALEGDEPAGAAGLYAAEGVAYLGLAGTMPGFRGKGAQSALLAERIRHAAALGCDRIVTETGERKGNRPSNSYRNILRAGFTEHRVTENWLGRS
jgi:GNAT superfamily N-acetyltransferase